MSLAYSVHVPRFLCTCPSLILSLSLAYPVPVPCLPSPCPSFTLSFAYPVQVPRVSCPCLLLNQSLSLTYPAHVSCLPLPMSYGNSSHVPRLSCTFTLVYFVPKQSLLCPFFALDCPVSEPNLTLSCISLTCPCLSVTLSLYLTNPCPLITLNMYLAHPVRLSLYFVHISLLFCLYLTRTLSMSLDNPVHVLRYPLPFPSLLIPSMSSFTPFPVPWLPCPYTPYLPCPFRVSCPCSFSVSCLRPHLHS
jgi:hypothetical protein